MTQQRRRRSGGCPTTCGPSAGGSCRPRSRWARGAGRWCRSGGCWTASCTCCARGANGRRCPANSAPAPRCTPVSRSGSGGACGRACGECSCAATTATTASGGIGSPPTARRCLPPLGGGATGPDPTNRGKLGTKRHVLSDRRGAPLSAVISAANRTDMKLAEATLDGIVVPRPEPTRRHPQHLCRDKGFDFPETREAAKARGYTVHTPVKGLDTPPPPPAQKHPARRWVVERTNSWHNRFRKLRIRYEKAPQNYLGLVHVACVLIVYRLRLVLG